jgi:hypothetical protein
MKLKELVDDIFKDGPIKPYDTMAFGVGNYTLYGEKELLEYKEKILQCDEFSEVDELNFMSIPFISVDNKSINAVTLKIDDNVKIKGKCYLLSIMYTPEMFDPSTFNKPVKDGAAITPAIYDIDTFEPKRSILLSFSPERKQEFPPSEFSGEELIRQELHDLLDKVIDNPDEYIIKGTRGLIVRGIFEKIESPKIPSPQNLSGIINKQDENPTHHIVFYLDKINTDKGVNLKLEQKLIPSELKDKFLEQFKEEGIHITGEQIDEFLKINNVNK